MRLFLNGWTDKDCGFYDVVLKLQEAGHKIIYWTVFNKFEGIDISKFPDTVFHDSRDALEAKPALGVDASKFLPVSAELIKEFYETEIAVLTMMNKKYERFSTDERKHLYYSMLSYWLGVLKQYQPDAIIFQGIPHTVFDFISYNVAKKLNIKTLFFKLTTLDDRLFLLVDYEIYPSALEDWKNPSKNYRLEDLSENIRKIYLKYKEDKFDTPRIFPGYIQYIQRIIGNNAGGSLIWKNINIGLNSLRNLTFFEKLFLYARKRFKQNLKKEYLSVQSPVSWNKKFIYFTLTYQPECSTSPQGGVFVDQILAIETLSSVLPEGWEIYVKEHPIQWLLRGLIYFSYRYQGYYKKIASLKNVKIIPMKTNSFELIRNCVAVANVTGSSAIEAALRLKPALIFGYEWYQNCPGIFQVNGPEDCRRALEQIKQGITLTETQLINYFALVDRHTLCGYNAADQRVYSAISREENARNICQALLSELGKNS